MSEQDIPEATWELFPAFVIRRTCTCTAPASSREVVEDPTFVSVVCVISEHRVTDVWIEVEPAQFEPAEAHLVEYGRRLAWPQWVVEFVEGENSPLWHPGQEVAQGRG